MRDAITDRDTADETLFDPADTIPAKCSCGTTRKNLCDHDARIDKGWIPASSTRPRTCLNRVDPSTMPFPQGF